MGGWCSPCEREIDLSSGKGLWLLMRELATHDLGAHPCCDLSDVILEIVADCKVESRRGGTGSLTNDDTQIDLLTGQNAALRLVHGNVQCCGGIVTVTATTALRASPGHTVTTGHCP